MEHPVAKEAREWLSMYEKKELQKIISFTYDCIKADPAESIYTGHLRALTMYMVGKKQTDLETLGLAFYIKQLCHIGIVRDH